MPGADTAANTSMPNGNMVNPNAWLAAERNAREQPYIHANSCDSRGAPPIQNNNNPIIATRTQLQLPRLAEEIAESNRIAADVTRSQ